MSDINLLSEVLSIIMTSYRGFRKVYSQSWIMKSVANANMRVFKMCVFITNEYNHMGKGNCIVWQNMMAFY